MANGEPTTLHPCVSILKSKIRREKHKYAELSLKTHIPEQRIKNIMTGRVDILLKERDLLCEAMGISTIRLDLESKDNRDNSIIDISGMPTKLRAAVSSLCNALL